MDLTQSLLMCVGMFEVKNSVLTIISTCKGMQFWAKERVLRKHSLNGEHSSLSVIEAVYQW